MLMCQDVATLASDYIDDELGPVKRLAIGAHLLMCRHCRSLIGNLRTTREIISQRSYDHLDGDYARRLDAAIGEALRHPDNGRTGPPKDPEAR